MALDRERVIRRTSYIREQTTALRQLLTERGKETILQDPWLISAVKYKLQTAIEACVDLTYHVCAKRLGQAPEDARDGLRRLKESGLISDAEQAKYADMVGFRNRLVHGYQEVSAEHIATILQEDLSDLDHFAEITLRLLSEEDPG
ncbi:MAG: type VII toxin-antitoxin system HepT family RNase toxin [Betaproteobacteria bacterium]